MAQPTTATTESARTGITVLARNFVMAHSLAEFYLMKLGSLVLSHVVGNFLRLTPLARPTQTS